MKNLKYFAWTLLAIIAVAIVACIDFSAINFATLISGGGIYLSAGVVVAWIKNEKFHELTAEEVDKLDESQAKEYHNALLKNRQEREEAIARKINELEAKAEQSAEVKEQIDKLERELSGITLSDIKEMMTAIKAHGEEFNRMKEEGIMSDSTFKSALKSAWDEGVTDSIAKSLEDNGNKKVKFEFKASQSYGDITNGSDFAQMKPGITDIPVRMPRIRNLFGVIPVSTEYFKYTEQETVVRDAFNVAKCATKASNTKETLKVSTIQTEVVKDVVEFCRAFVSDYPFMESRIRRLLDQSIALKIDQQLLLGTGVAPQLNSINLKSSEFSATNPAADISGSIQDASYVDLVLGMETQIIELGEQNAFVPDTVLVNKVDWFKFVQCRKDANNNYLDARVTVSGGDVYVGGMRVVWTTLVPQNTLYVFDSTKGEIVDRQTVEIEIAFQNKDNWEKEIADLKGYERLNFLVENNNANAFMRCSDVATAIGAITEVVAP